MKYLPTISKSAWLTLDEFVPKISSTDNYRQMKKRGQIRVTCINDGGSRLFIEFNSLPKAYKEKVIAEYGDVAQYIAAEPLRKMINNLVVQDDDARMFFAYHTMNCGEPIQVARQARYGRQCDWLNAISKCMADKKNIKEHYGITVDVLWEAISTQVNNETQVHELPTSVDRLRRKWNMYRAAGRQGLIEEWRFGNDFARKVGDKTEALMLALQAIKYKPTLADVHEYYNQFMAGELIDLVDLETGEQFNPKDFNNEGKAKELSLATIKNYLNTPENKAKIDSKRMSALEYNNTHRPHMMRKGPFYAFSKVTMDDTASPFKMLNGERPATYKLFDVASTALICTVMHDQKRPDAGLIRSLIMGVISLIAKNGWKMPAEIEMERAITSTMAGGYDPAQPDKYVMDVLSAGAVFPYTRWCKAKNPQEKRAEGFIKQIKYGYHKHRDGFQERPFAKLTHNKANEDAKDMLFTYQDIYGFEMQDMAAYNAAPHPNQELYPGMSRWQVLEQCQNPNLGVLDLSQVMPYVGYKTRTSVRRMKCQVQGIQYMLPEAAILGELNEPDVVAYYLPEDDGTIGKVYLYQDGKYICEAKKAERFQEAKAEQTDDDLKIMGKQDRYIKEFDAMVQAGITAIPAVGVVKRGGLAALPMTGEVEVMGVEGGSGLPMTGDVVVSRAAAMI